MSEHGLAPRALAVARGRAYDLLADLFSAGPRRLEHLRAVAALAPHLPDEVDDAVLAHHHRVLVLEVPPMAGVFLHPEGLVGGETARSARAAMEAAGYSPDTRSSEADHISASLGFLAWLCAAEADAWRDGRVDVAEALRAQARTFLDAHLLRWLPPFVVAVETVDDALYRAACAVLMELVTDHLGRPPAERDLPVPARAVLREPRAGVRQIADHLALPVQAGALLTPTWLSDTARGSGTATGFGRRAQRLESLLLTAARRGEMDGTLRAMVQRVGGLADRLAALPAGGAWSRRCRSSQALVEEMSAALRAEGVDGA